ncbi:MAG TPA: ABC transporter permease [Candidatus Eremiobacteraceae bacterium]|nr:ABC transporter permease [Candidatus Eremiobacteraceae bacterium]
MKPLAYLRSLLSTLFHPADSDGELDEEFCLHIQRHADDLERAGLSRAEAERRARIAFGSAAKAKEQCREQRPGFHLETVWKDLRFGLRMLRKSPTLTITATLTLALGIGANTAIFSVIDTVLLRPLPYKNPSSLVWATERFPFVHGASNVISPDFLAWQNHNQVFQQIGAFGGGSGANLTGSGEPTRVDITNVTTGLFPMLGVNPVVGRSFLPEEGRQAKDNVALLSESLWRSRFAADPQIVGKTIRLDDDAYTVVGVMPVTLRYPAADIWTPFALDDQVFSPQSPRWSALTVIGRLKPNATTSQAQSDLQLITERMDQEYPPEAGPFRANVRIEVIPLHALLVQNVRSLLLILLGAVAFILLIACANVANLLLSQGVVRGREMAVRAAVGASRSRLIRQMLTEASVLAVAGSLLGLVVGLWATKILQQLIPVGLPSDVHLDPRILVFCAAITILVILIFGFLPAWLASRPYVQEALRVGGSQQGTAPTAHGLRGLLSAGEIALSLVLLVGAGLLARSFLLLSEVPLGFDPHGMLVATVERPVTTDRHASRYATFFQDTLQRMKALPGVQDAALTTHYPLSIPNGATGMLTVQGSQPVRIPSPIFMNSASPGYLRTMRIPLLKGRFFLDSDTADAPAVVILNKSLAQIAFGEREPIGQHISFGPPPQSWLEVVGVVADTVGGSIEKAPSPEVFTPYLQDPSFNMTFVLRTQSHPEALASSVRAAVQSVDKNQPLANLTAMDAIIAESVAPRRFRMLLLSLFALLALAMATIGTYGVMSYSVEQRTHEIGVRTALGAAGHDILALIVSQGLKIAFFGIVAGVCGALALTRFMANMLYGVSATDPLTFALVALLLFSAALAACYLPARRAAKVDPMVALRTE